jgi:hypothetical protein
MATSSTQCVNDKSKNKKTQPKKSQQKLKKEVNKKVYNLTSGISLSGYGIKNPKYAAYVTVNSHTTWSPYYDSKEEAVLELLCIQKRLSVETFAQINYYPERTAIIEEKYQQSGRTNGLYTGLNLADGTLPNDTPN